MMGPLITAAHRDRVRSYVDGAGDEGAQVVVDGSAPPDPDGFFLGCSLLDRVTPGMRVYDDEIFGPVLSVVRVGTFDEAVALVNANPYGNGVALFTRDGGAARRFEREHRGRHGRDQRPDPGAGGVATPSGAGSRRCSATAPIYGPEGVQVLHPAQGHHVALARAPHRLRRPRLPDQLLSEPAHAS